MDQAFPIDRHSGVAAWKQIADRISRSIQAGDYDANGMVPPETVLAVQFGVNRHTVRSAIASLAEDGWLRRVQGKGTLIEKKQRMVFPISRRTRFTDGVGPQASDTESRLLQSSVEAARGEVASGLAIAVQDPVVFAEILRLVDAVPVSLARNYFPASRFATIAGDIAATGSITRAFAAQGLSDYLRASTEVIGRSASQRESEQLGLHFGAVILETISINTDSEGRPVQYARTVFAAERISLRLDTATA